MKKLINYQGEMVALMALALLLAVALAPLQAFAANLLSNGGFEEPAVSNGGWGVFPSGDVPGWDVEWTDGSGGGTLEFQNPPIAGISAAAEGEQYVELGSDGKADASVTILQSVDTCAGGEYELIFSWQPRPAGLNTHLMNTYVDGDLVGSYSTASDSYDAGEWNLESHTFDGTGGAVEIVFEEAGSADTLGMLLDGVSVELAEETCDSDVPAGEITSPSEGEVVYGEVTFSATYSDNDPQGVDWAIRTGTCDANDAFNVYGNVGGFNDDYDWDGSDFEFVTDVSGLTPGDYCFIFNPREENDEDNVRLTRWFAIPDVPDQVLGMDIIAGGESLGCYPTVEDRSITVDWDDSTAPDFSHYEYQADANQSAPFDFTTNVVPSERSGMIRDEDGTYHYRVRAVSTFGLKGAWSDWCGVTLDRDTDDDGVTNDVDICPLDTSDDVITEDLGTNRWMIASLEWITLDPAEKGKGKGKANGPDFAPTIQDTRGCGCTQILGWLNDYDDELYGDMLGHYKFGCSKSALEDFMTLTAE